MRYTLCILIILVLFNYSISYCEILKGKVSASNINVRDNNSINSKVIGSLNRGDEVTLLNEINNKVLIGKYYGKWVKIEFKDKIKGYILDCFIDIPNNKEEKFHVFIDRFINSARGTDDYKFYLSRFNFPLQIYSFDTISGNTSTYADVSKIPEFYKSKGMWDSVSKEESELKKDIIIFGYYCDGCGISQYWHFKLINKMWKCIKITRSNS